MLSDTSSEMGASSGSNGSVAILDVQNALKVLEKNCTNSDKVPSIYYVSNFRGEGGTVLPTLLSTRTFRGQMVKSMNQTIRYTIF